jgi:O-antigen ligase
LFIELANWRRGALAGPFFFVAFAAACAGSRLGAITPWFLAALALGAAAGAGSVRPPHFTPISASVLVLAALIALNTMLWSPAYTAAGLYIPLLLAIAYLAVFRASPPAESGMAKGALVAVGVLALWGLWELGMQGTARAHTIFETPATYAAVLNLALVPLAGAVLSGSRARLAVPAVVLLAAAVFAAQSRGAMLALAGGIGVALVLGARASLIQRRAVAAVCAALLLGWALSIGLRALAPGSGDALPGTEARAESSLSRLELYALSWRTWQEHPVAGTGFHTFRYALEQGRASVPSYGRTNETWFVHNDYLQMLQELGVPGLIALLGITVLPLLLAHRRLSLAPRDEQVVLVASASALAGMLVHALVDFPFYVPACLVLYGAWLGALDKRLYAATALSVTPAPVPAWRRAVRTGAWALATVLLLRPVAAEAAAEYGLRMSAAGESRDAAFWLETARRIEPRDWRYHWYVGQFWAGQAAAAGKPDAARLAAEAFAGGFEENPLEVRNLLGMISVHRRYSQLLAAPADARTLERWRAQAAALAPFHPALAAERVR